MGPHRGVSPLPPIALAVFGALALSGAEAPRDLPLAPGASMERALAGGERHAYRIEGAGGPLLVTVEQRGINVALDAAGPDGESLGVSNQSGEREGWESLLLPAGQPGSWRVEVIARETDVPPGRYEIRIEELPDGTPDERRRALGEALLAEMGRQRALGDGEATRKIASLGDEALARFRDLAHGREEARAFYLQAEARRSLGDAKGAAPGYERASALFAAAGYEAGESQAETALGLCRWSLGDPNEALAHFDGALAIERRRSDLYGEAVTLSDVCLVRHSRGEWREAIPCYEDALRRLEAVRAPDSEAAARANLGGVYDLLGEPGRAREAYERALVPLRALGDRHGEISVLNNLGVLSAGTGETAKAFALYDQALDLAVRIGDRSWEAKVRQNRGSAYVGTGEPARAADELTRALALRRELGDRKGEINALGLLGRAREQQGDFPAALDLEGRAVGLAREAADKNLEATALNWEAQTRLAAGEAAPALDALGRAVELFRALGNRRGLAAALHRVGEARLLSGGAEEAVAPLDEALALRRSFEDRAGQAETLTALAMADRRLGRLESAERRLDEALGLVESVRAAVVAPDLRASFLAAKARTFELSVSVRMELDRKEPGRGHAEAALGASERARARSLLDLLQEARADPQGGTDPELERRAEDLGQRLAAKARRRIEMLAGAASAAEKEASARELFDLLAEDDRLAAEIRAKNPRSAALAFETLDAAGIRRLLDPGTLLLEYALGEERSFLWAVTSEGVASFDLPGRAAIETLARRVYEDLRTVGAGDPRELEAEAQARRDLGLLLLGPVADRLADRRLVVVADGALQYVPFAALPLPGAADEPLLERHEIALLPSASALAIVRGAPERPRASRAAVLVADPVFGREDPRVQRVPGTSQPAPADAARGGLALERLPASRREAEAIAALVPGGASTLFDFAANRAAVLSGALSGFRIVHFATHGVIDAETPQLSGLVLSLVDERGRPEEGFLGLADLYGLKLSADLVVLSGCDTALGREMRGEGLVGLTRGFFHAGAPRVLASLWKVQDRPTAELMVRFYRALLSDRLPPAAALRQAQLGIRSERRTRDPFYWAAFVLEGDWAER